jgi:hypothetical protein
MPIRVDINTEDTLPYDLEKIEQFLRRHLDSFLTENPSEVEVTVFYGCDDTEINFSKSTGTYISTFLNKYQMEEWNELVGIGSVNNGWVDFYLPPLSDIQWANTIKEEELNA